jgi:hypothetical protein
MAYLLKLGASSWKLVDGIALPLVSKLTKRDAEKLRVPILPAS